MYKDKSSHGANGEVHSHCSRMFNSFPSGNYSASHNGYSANTQRGFASPMGNMPNPNVFGTAVSEDNAATKKHIEVGGQVLPEELDDEDILESIDVDQIFMEHCQAICTPQPSNHKLPPVTPCNDNIGRQDEMDLPFELGSTCIHGLKVLILFPIDDLIDYSAKLTPELLKKLRNDRSQLNRQIHYLENRIPASGIDEDRKLLQFSASTAFVIHFQYETPRTFGSSIEPFRLEAHVLRKQPGGYDQLSSPFVSLTSERFSFLPPPMDRTFHISNAYVSYIEGSLIKK